MKTRVKYRGIGRWLMLALALLSLGSSTPPRAAAVYAIANINKMGATRLANLKQHEGVLWWVEADDKMLLALADEETQQDLQQERYTLTPPAFAVNPSLLYVIPSHYLATITQQQQARLLVAGGRLALVQLPKPQPIFYSGQEFRGVVNPLSPNTILAHQANNMEIAKEAANYPIELAAELDAKAWHNHIAKLSSWNRYTHSTDIIKARDYIAEQLRAMPNMDVRLDSFPMGSTTAYNVVATLTGSERPNDIYIIGAHYDSISENPSQSAPGAEDNASGTAGMMELARVFANHPPKATMVFIAFSGEEQNLNGSRYYVKNLLAANRAAQVKRAIIMDMISYTANGQLACILETHQRNAAMVNDLSAAAQAASRLRIVVTYDYWGSDHVPFIDNNIPAVLAIENDYGNYPAYHRTNDTISQVNMDMGLEVLKMNVTALGKWVLE